MNNKTHPLFTAAMREHDRIVAQAKREATAIYVISYVCSTVVIATAFLFALGS